MHLCHKWDELTTMVGTSTTNTFVPIVIPAA